MGQLITKVKDAKADKSPSKNNNAPGTELAPQFSNAGFDLVAIAASAGGLKAIIEVLSRLPADFPAPIVIVQHLDPRHRSLMADILSRRTPLKVKQAEEADYLSPGKVYIAPSNCNLQVNPNGTLSLKNEPSKNHFPRPSADRLFESVADCYGERVIAVVLSGTGTDGMKGVKAVKKMGGIAIAQNEETSEFFGMPNAAIGTGKVDFILPLAEISSNLISLVSKKKQ